MSRFLAAFATVALVLSPPAGAAAGRQPSQTPSVVGAVTGRVEFADNQRAPLRRATVTLKDESGKPTRTTATDQNGAYRFEGLPAGNYRVSVEKAGFLTTPESSVALAVTGGEAINFIAQRAAALEGSVIEDTGKPIPGLVVTAHRLADEAGQPAVEKSYSAKTDDLGRFRVHTIPSGRYRISATPPPPASGAQLYYPGTEKIEDAGMVTIGPSQTIERLTFTVRTEALPAIIAEALATQELEGMSAPTRGGTWSHVSGRVTRSDTGLPIVNAAVKLSNGGVLLRTAWTDGNGEYAFSRVMAGTYALAVSADGYANPDAAPGRPGSGGARITVGDGTRPKKDLALTPLGAIEGRALDEFGDPAPGVFLRLVSRATAVSSATPTPGSFAVGPTDDRGWFRVSGLVAGDYNLTALPEPFARSGPTAFPITSAPLQLVAGIDVHGVNLTLPAVPTTVISGTVIDATGRRVPKALVTLSPILDGQSIGILRAPVTADANGNFVFPNASGGTYLVEARTGAFDVGSLTIAAPTEPFVLPIKPLPIASGRVIFDGDAPPEIKPQLREVFLHGLVRFEPIGTIEESIRFGRQGVVELDWTFQIRGLSSPGVIRAGQFAELADGWVLARVLHQGRDITDVQYDFQSGDVDGLEVVLTKRVGGVTGSVQDGARAADNVSVVVFGADGDSWPYLSRTLRFTQTNESGAFTLQGLLPGRYLAVAIKSGTRPSSPEDLQKLRATATPVFVSEGADTALKLTVVK